MLLTKAKNIFSFIKLKLFIVVIASLPFDTILSYSDLKKSSQVSNASTKESNKIYLIKNVLFF